MGPTLRKLLNSALVFTCTVLLHFSAFTQIELDVTDDAEALASSLVGEGVIISGVETTCHDDGMAFFECIDCNVGMTSGITLVSGPADETEGPNSSTSTGEDTFTPGDPDLDDLTTSETHNACVLEFDVTVTSDTLRFNYVFGSEEYTTYVNSSYNDVFGFFISGPGIAGTENLAVLPGTEIPVTINNVNPLENEEFYIDNGVGCIDYGGYCGEESLGAPYTTDDSYIEWDGFTVVLEAKRAVIPCETYHLKLAIADAGDGALDSGVFIEAGSLSSPGVTISYSTEIEDYPYLIEGCNEGVLDFVLSFAPVDTFDISVGITGTAANGTDYALIEDTITFYPGGDTSFQLILNAFEDGLDEGVETIVISVDLGCTIGFDDSLVIYVYDALPLAISNDTMICPGDPAYLVASGGDTYSWEPSATLDTPNEAETTAHPEEPTTYTVTGSLAACTNTADVFVDIQGPTAYAGEDTTIFFGETASLGAEGGVSYEWSPTTGLSDPNSQNPFASPTTTTTYTVTVTTAIGCEFSDEVTVFVSSDAQVDIPNAFSPNGDGTNDGFAVIVRGQLSSYSMQIYNRWGELVYETTDYTKPWYGDFDGEAQPIGSFVYVLNYTDMNGVDFFHKGNFTLVR